MVLRRSLQEQLVLLFEAQNRHPRNVYYDEWERLLYEDALTELVETLEALSEEDCYAWDFPMLELLELYNALLKQEALYSADQERLTKYAFQPLRVRLRKFIIDGSQDSRGWQLHMERKLQKDLKRYRSLKSSATKSS